MPTTVDRDRVLLLIEHGAQLVEVLPRHEYDEEHLPDAIHLPLKSLDQHTAAVLDTARPVVVYCWDALCDMSPRAAWRLERLGFDVYDYAASKVDWMAAGLPTVQARPLPRRALDQADRDPPTCTPDTRVGDLDTPSALVVTKQRVVLGRIRTEGHPPSARAEDVMEPGPATVRAHEPLNALLARMQQRNVREIVVTTPEGRLLGVLRPTG